MLKTATLEVQSLRELMAEAQEVFGIEFDPFPPPQLGLPDGVILPSGTVAGCSIDLDLEKAAGALRRRPRAAKPSRSGSVRPTSRPGGR